MKSLLFSHNNRAIPARFHGLHLFRPWRACLAFACSALLLFFYMHVAAAQNVPELARGQQWLLAQLQQDGSLRSGPEQHASPTQAAAEVARTLKLTDMAPAGLVDQVVADADDSTEYLARRILVLRATGRASAEDLSRLVKLQNADGGFGGAADYTSNVLDTAWAVSALSNSSASADAVKSALRYLLAGQRSSGAFGFSSGPDDVALTGLVVAALLSSASGTEVPAAIDRALAWLRARQNADGGFGPVLDSSLAQLALLGANSDAGVLAMNRSYLLARQDADGSWGGDLYITAVALRALTA